MYDIRYFHFTSIQQIILEYTIDNMQHIAKEELPLSHANAQIFFTRHRGVMKKASRKAKMKEPL